MNLSTKLKHEWREMRRNIAIALHPPPEVETANVLWADPQPRLARQKLYRAFGVQRFKGHYVTRLRPVPDALWPYRIQPHEWKNPLSPSARMFAYTLKRYQEAAGTPQHQSVQPTEPSIPIEESVLSAFIGRDLSPYPGPLRGPQEFSTKSSYQEGAMRQMISNKYERNPIARQKCIDHYGCRCFVCGFNFQQVYGELGAGFIHVHHLKPLSEIQKEYVVDPVADMRPICPNCHAMIHNRREILTIEALTALIKPKSATIP